MKKISTTLTALAAMVAVSNPLFWHLDHGMLHALAAETWSRLC